MATALSPVYSATSTNGRAMPNDTRQVTSTDTIEVETTERATAERETWQHWWPDEPAELTRQEIVDRLRAEGVAVTVQDIANWQRTGVLPRGTSRRTGRALQMLYPVRYLDLLRDLRELQEEGLRLADIGPRLRVKHYRKPRTVRGKATVTSTSSVSARASVRRGDPALTADDGLAQTLRTIARKHEQTYGGHIARVELRLIDDHGNPLTLALDDD